MRSSQPTRLQGARTQKTTNQISTVYSEVPDHTTSWPQCMSLPWEPSIMQYRVTRTYSKLLSLVTNYWTTTYNDPVDHKWNIHRTIHQTTQCHNTEQHIQNFTVGNQLPDCRMQRPRRRQSHAIQETPMTEQHYTEPVSPRHSESSEHKLHCVTTQKTRT